MSRIIFSIFIDIPKEDLDNPGWYDQGKQVITDKSKQTKLALLNNAELVTERQKQYANDWGGTNDGQVLPKASYLYMIDADGNGTIDYQGWVFITR